jgi:hypothetical protein
MWKVKKYWKLVWCNQTIHEFSKYHKFPSSHQITRVKLLVFIQETQPNTYLELLHKSSFRLIMQNKRNILQINFIQKTHIHTHHKLVYLGLIIKAYFQMKYSNSFVLEKLIGFVVCCRCSFSRHKLCCCQQCLQLFVACVCVCLGETRTRLYVMVVPNNKRSGETGWRFVYKITRFAGTPCKFRVLTQKICEANEQWSVRKEKKTMCFTNSRICNCWCELCGQQSQNRLCLKKCLSGKLITR